MKKIEKIAAALDFSEYSPEVLTAAVHLARVNAAKLVVVNIINKRDVDAVKMVEDHDSRVSSARYVEELIQERTALIDKLIIDAAATDLTVKKAFSVDIPFKGILKAVTEEKAQMLVMGTKGRGNLAEVLFGSTAEKVFRRCPVLLVSVRSGKLV